MFRVVPWLKASFIVILVCQILGCTTTRKAYSGPELRLSEVAVVDASRKSGFGETSKRLVLIDINGESQRGDWLGDETPVYLLPGEYRLRFKYVQASPRTGLIILDMATAESDRRMMADHKEATLTLEAKAGMIQRVYYDVDDRSFFVTREEAVDGFASTPWPPPVAAVPCAKGADRSAPLWCEYEIQESLKWPRLRVEDRRVQFRNRQP